MLENCPSGGFAITGGGVETREKREGTGKVKGMGLIHRPPDVFRLSPRGTREFLRKRS